MRFIFTTVAILATFLTQSAANAADMHTVAPGEVAKIEAHGVCRMVGNVGSAPFMVPARASNEWSSGANAFLQNLATMPGVTVTPCGPTPACFLWTTGLIPSDTNYFGQNKHRARIGDTSLEVLDTQDGIVKPVSDMVGAGDYPDAYGSASAPGPLWGSAMWTLDGLAVGPSAKVTFYAGNNFTGGVVYQVEGPAVIVNDSLTDPYSMLGKKEFITNDWSGDPSEYVSQFTIALRYLVKDSVFSWLGKKPASLWASKTSSFRVTCD